MKAIAELLWANGHSLEPEVLSSVGVLLGDELKQMDELVNQLYAANS